MTTQPHAEPHPICPDPCGCTSQTGCGTGGSSGCPVDLGPGGAEVSNSYGSTPREGNFRLTWYNLWHHDGVPTDFYGNVGVNWSIDALAYMTVNSANELAFVWTPGRGGKALWFEPVGGGYQGKFGARQVLEEVGDIWRITEPDGTIWEFSAIDELVSKHITPGGVVTEYLKDNGRIIEKLQVMGDYAESRVFSYTDGNVSTVTLSRGTDLDPYETLIRRFVLTYYTTLQSGLGNPGDLKTVTTQVRQGMSWVDAGTSYYRYYTENEAPGYKHGLKFVVGPTGYAKLVEEFTNPDTAEDDDVKEVSQQALAYEQVLGTSTRRVSYVATHGGTQEYNIEYVEGENPEGFNSWQLKSTARMPDGSTKTVFANHTGQDMLVDHKKEGVGQWIYYSRYNDDGRIELRARPSAINMAADPIYDPGDPDLDVQLKQDEGLIERTTYYGSMATAPGYPEYQQVQKGETGSKLNGRLIDLSKLEYEKRTVGGIDFFVVNKRTVYQSDAAGGSDEVVTDYENVFYSGKVQLQQVTEELPDVPDTQNGGTWLEGNTRVQKFSEELGQLTETIDARGTVTEYEYAEATGTLSRMIQDQADLDLVTDYEVDGMGRPTKTLGPEHKVDNVLIRTVEWTVYLDDVHEVRRASGYYLVGDEEYWLVNPVTIIKSNPGGQVTDEIQAVRGSGVESSGELIGGDSFPQSSWTRWTRHNYGDNGRLESTDVYHLIPDDGPGLAGTNYNRTEFGYDSMGRQNTVTSPTGTITKTVYDPRGLVLSVSVGTDEPSMRVVTENTYDADAYGTDADSLDGLLTKVTSYVNDLDTRVVEYRYDWRDRQIETITTDGMTSFHESISRDNLGRSIKMRSLSNELLVATEDYFYDDRGQFYRTMKSEVNSGNP
jgi:hypothetical protein